MANQVFYVGSTDDGHRLTGYVPAKFLTINGQPVVDPTPPNPQWLKSGVGSDSPSQAPADLIGDGRGIASWISSLYGINPSNPTQPVLQQQTTGRLGLVSNQPMLQWPVPPPIFNAN